MTDTLERLKCLYSAVNNKKELIFDDNLNNPSLQREYNRAIDDIKSKYGDLYAEVK